MARNTDKIMPSGTFIHLPEILASDIHIADIAHILSRTERWGGVCSEHVMVSDHLLFCHMVVMKVWPAATHTLQLHALIHDAHEAYTGDIPTPLKGLFTEAGFRKIVERIDDMIYEAFEVPHPSLLEKAQIGYVDALSILVEANRWVHHNFKERFACNEIVEYEDCYSIWGPDSRIRWRDMVDREVEAIHNARIHK